MDIRCFFQALKAQSLSGAYLLCGEEEFLKDQALSACVQQIDPVARELNLEYLDAGTVDDVTNACETLPFFADRRLVVCRFLPQGDAGKALAAYLPKLPDTTLLLFFLRGKADEKLALIKALRKQDRVVDFDPLSPQEATRWVCKQAVRLQGAITQSAARFLVDLVGVQVSNLHNELTKAAFYAGHGQEITREAIAACVTRNPELRVFDMVDAFLAGKAQEGLRIYHRMLSDGESPFRMAALLEGNFRRMALAKACMEQGMGREEALKKLGNTFPMKKAWDQARGYSKAQLLENLQRFADVGYLQVSGQAKDADALERALILCMPSRGLQR
ncbi:MAG: DNA polymerase III subunit delta [Oscillospiraceae bacterium]